MRAEVKARVMVTVTLRGGESEFRCLRVGMGKIERTKMRMSGVRMRLRTRARVRVRVAGCEG